MNDKDFDKIFGDRLREERRFKEDDNDWTRLVARFDAVSGGSLTAITGDSNRFRRWLLPLIALLLLLTTGLLFGKLNHLDKTNTALMEQMQSLKMPLNTTHDTVFITKTDTVFIERNSTKQSIKTTFLKSKSDNFNGLNNSNSPLNNSNKYQLINPNNKQLINSNSSINSNDLQLILANEKELKDKINELENKLQVSESQRLVINDELIKLKDKINKTPLETELNQSDLINKLTSNLINKNDSFNLIIASKDALITKLMTEKTIDSSKISTQIKEKGPLSTEAKNIVKTNKKPITPRLFVGAGGGLIYYKATWKSTLNNVDFYRNEKSYQVGLKLEYALTDRLRLTAGGDYCPFDFKIFWQDNRYNLPTPMHFYPTNEKIKSSTALQKLAQGSIGTKYLFTDGTKRWRPYVGAAYTAMKILPFDTEYEIQNIASGAIRLHTEASTGLNIANLLLLNGGLEYRFNRRFVVQGEAFYNLDMNRPQKTYDLFGLRGAFLLNF